MNYKREFGRIKGWLESEGYGIVHSDENSSVRIKIFTDSFSIDQRFRSDNERDRYRDAYNWIFGVESGIWLVNTNKNSQ